MIGGGNDTHLQKESLAWTLTNSNGSEWTLAINNRVAGASFQAEYCSGVSDTGKGQHGGLVVDSRDNREAMQLEGLKRC